MIDQTTRLILNVGNVIHDDVCMALSRVNFKELEDAPHSDRVDAAAAKIIAMIEQDVARRLRAAVALYMKSEGCSCCEGWNHDAHARNLANLLDMDIHDDGSGVEYEKYLSTVEPQP